MKEHFVYLRIGVEEDKNPLDVLEGIVNEVNWGDHGLVSYDILTVDRKVIDKISKDILDGIFEVRALSYVGFGVYDCGANDWYRVKGTIPLFRTSNEAFQYLNKLRKKWELYNYRTNEVELGNLTKAQAKLYEHQGNSSQFNPSAGYYEARESRTEEPSEGERARP